jgi:tRNA 2-thiouridine synthesizing protein A
VNADLANLAIAKVVDARGNTCPGPLLEAKRGIGQVKIGEVLEIKSSDPGTRKDIPAWARKVGHDYLGFLEAEEHDRLFIARKK